MKTIEERISELKESIDDGIESIRSIKGEDYAATVAFVFASMRTIRLLVPLAPEDPKRVELVIRQHAEGIDTALTLLAEKCEFSETDMKEIVGWAEKFDERTEAVAREINRE